MCLLLQIGKHPLKATRIRNNQGSLTPPKEQNKAQWTDPNEMEIYELSEKEFQIIILKKLSELQENSDN